MDEIKSDPNLGSTTRKRGIIKKCKKVMVYLKDVCKKYQEYLSSVLGNSIIFGGNNEKEEVRDIISNVVDLVGEGKGSKKKVWQIFFPQELTKKSLPA